MKLKALFILALTFAIFWQVESSPLGIPSQDDPNTTILSTRKCELWDWKLTIESSFVKKDDGCWLIYDVSHHTNKFFQVKSPLYNPLTKTYEGTTCKTPKSCSQNPIPSCEEQNQTPICHWQFLD